MPAEWAPHAATWIAWPHNESDWPGKFAPIRWVYGEFVRLLAPHERVRILVPDDAVEAEARATLELVGAAANWDLVRVPTNRSWTRDTGPLFVLARRRESGPRTGASTPGRSTTTGSSTSRWRRRSRAPRAWSARASRRTAPTSCSRAAPSTSTARARCWPPRSACRIACSAATPSCRPPSWSACCATSSAPSACCGWAAASPATTRTGTSTIWRASSRPGVVVLCQEPDARDENYRALAENRERLAGRA